MSTGLPIIATEVGGNPEVVVHGHTGSLVAPGHPDQLAQEMIRFACSPETLREMSQLGRSRLTTFFEIRQMVANYESLYQQVIESRGVPR